PAAEAAPARWRLSVAGLVANPCDRALAELLPQLCRERSCAIHCVTGWSRLGVRLTGMPLAELLAGLGIDSRARFVRFVAASARGHDTSLPLELALADTWLVVAIDGRPLSMEHGGPLRSVTPGRYFYKSLKWLTRIELLAEDQPGYWERDSAYHNQADPWLEQRFDPARAATPELTAALRNAHDFGPWRGRPLLRARLGGWRPRDADLSGLVLKNCSLRAARLAGHRLAGANLSLSNLEGAELAGADLTGADCEGASFAGADLRGASLRGARLSATRFFRDFASGKRLAARVEGLDLRGAGGLLEDQLDFLLAGAARL
ncbi:MAG: molybdopterin-dependent oxidoreductase, partial [Gammaproteobacteria bacterium]|nr:molybdopterin-dependent oxidoreductase [Gammaproteobacteria bacterium]